MKSKLIHRCSLMLAVIVMAVMFLADTGFVLADNGGSYSLDIPETLWVGQGTMSVVVKDADEGTCRIESVTLSDTEVLKVYKYKYSFEGKYYYDINIEPAKPGKTTITVKLTTPHNTHGTLTKTISVKKYPKAIKKLKVNGKRVKLAANIKTKTSGTVDQRFSYFVRNKKDTGRIKISLKKGWRVSKVSGTLSDVAGDNFKDYSEKITKKTILKGKKFRFPKSWDELYVNVTLKNKDGEALDYTIIMYRRAHY